MIVPCTLHLQGTMYEYYVMYTQALVRVYTCRILTPLSKMGVPPRAVSFATRGQEEGGRQAFTERSAARTASFSAVLWAAEEEKREGTRSRMKLMYDVPRTDVCTM